MALSNLVTQNLSFPPSQYTGHPHDAEMTYFMRNRFTTESILKTIDCPMNVYLLSDNNNVRFDYR